jgi:hypothetical protein
MLGNELINMFPYSWILGNQLFTEHVFCDTKMKDISTEVILGNQHVPVGSTGVSVNKSDQQIFPWMLIAV